MKMIARSKEKIVVFILSLFFIIGFVPRDIAGAKRFMKVGDYVQFGTYSNEPILWRVISVDASGSPMIFSDAVLCVKDFDLQGSANWERSSIRRWLNSSEEKVNSDNGYDEQESGFLFDFTKEEQDTIKLVPRKSILSIESESRDGGTELYKYDKYTTGVQYTSNYQITYSYNEGYYDKAFYKIVLDKVCLLSEKEIFDTEKVLQGEKSGDNSYTVFRCKGDNYWLRTPYMPSGGTSVIYVNSGGGMDYSAIG